ncbi:hypothetical protein [Amorphus sp. MBR-141]
MELKGNFVAPTFRANVDPVQYSVALESDFLVLHLRGELAAHRAGGKSVYRREPDRGVCMRVLIAIGVACIFAGVTMIFNDLITHWWGETAGVNASQATVSVPGLMLAAVGIVLTVAAEKARARGRRRKSVAEDGPGKTEKVVLYEHGPDRPY